LIHTVNIDVKGRGLEAKGFSNQLQGPKATRHISYLTSTPNQQEMRIQKREEAARI